MDSERSNVVERISFIDVRRTWQASIYPNLLTLCVKETMDIIEFSNLQYMTKLKVLDLSGIPRTDDLPIEIGKLINLEFLNLSRTNIRCRLPIELKNLKKLRVFLMEYIMGEIPLEVFESLEQLQVFRYSGFIVAKEEEEILQDKLESLPDLVEVGVGLNTITSMHKLHGCLRKFWLARIKEQLEMVSLLSSWSTMKHLERIWLSGLDDLRHVSSITHTWHLDNLRQLVIRGCYSTTHLTWLRYAPLLEFLRISRCYSMEEVEKGGQDEDEDEDDVGVDLFSNLRRLVLFELPKLKSIHKRALPFPSLKSIYIVDCPNLRKLPLNCNSAKDTLIEIEGKPEWWDDLEWDDPAIKDLFHSKFKPFPWTLDAF